MGADVGYRSLLKQHAEENMLLATDAERALWQLLQSKSMGCKFCRQHIVDETIASFVDLQHKLVIEIKGNYHFFRDQIISEEAHTALLNGMGYTVVRLTNEEILANINKVGQQIKDLIRHMEIFYPTNTPAPAASASQQTPASVPSASAPPAKLVKTLPSAVNTNAWAVDAACSGNPGPMEYQCIDLTTGERIFHYGPVHGTNNIGEFLAIVHALALLTQRGITDKAIYSDSYNALVWVKNKKCKTKLERNAQTEQLHQVIARAEEWLRTHTYPNPVLKWETKKWGEIPADFGNKR